VCCIDELDKMACDPHALLEAMEQQQISIAKAGVVTKVRPSSPPLSPLLSPLLSRRPKIVPIYKP